MRGEPRLTHSLALDNALPSWITPNNQNWFSFLRTDRQSEPQILPLAIQVFQLNCQVYILAMRLSFYPFNF